MQFYYEAENAYFKNNSVHVELQKFYQSGIAAAPHMHSALELILINEGTFEAEIGNRTYLARPGDLLLVRSNTIHRYTGLTGTPASYWVLKVKPALITEIAASDRCGEYLMFFAMEREDSKSFWTAEEMKEHPLCHAINQLLKECEKPNYGVDIGIRLAVSQILLAILRDVHATQPTMIDQPDESLARRIYDAVVYINKNYSQNISAEDCSRIACMSYSYFSRSFRTVTGKSFKEYLTQVRIAHAERMLLTADCSVTQVALQCGYDSAAYFCSVYKRVKGVTPYSTARQKQADTANMTTT